MFNVPRESDEVKVLDQISQKYYFVTSKSIIVLQNTAESIEIFTRT